MTKKRRQFDKGIKLRPDTSAVTEEGEVKYDDTSKKVQYRDDSTTRDVVSEDGTQTLTNKTIDADNNTVSNLEVDNLKAGVLDTDLTAVSASDDTIPSAKATKDYVDSQVASKDEASEISYDNTSSGLTATEVQSAIDETEARLDTAESNITTAQSTADDHIADAVDAHDASAISNVPAGNLAATDVQGALNELQTDVDTRATDSDLTTHTGASSAHGTTGDVVGTTDTQTLTNKTIQGASIETPSRSDVKQDTKANLVTYASTASNGQTVYATDTKEFFVITDNALVEVGGGAGDVDYLTVIKDFDTSSGLTTEASGVNAGTFRLTHDAVSTEFAEKTITVTNKFKDKILALRLDKRSTASSGNFKVIITDETNSVTLADEQIAPQVDGVTTDKKMVTFSTAPADGDLPIDSIKVRFEALAEAGAPFSEFDDVVVELNTTEKREITATVQETNTFSARIANNGTASIISQSESFINTVTRTSAGVIAVTFKAGFFSVAPTVNFNSVLSATQHFFNVAATTSGFTVQTRNSTNTPIDVDIELMVQRQGSDYKDIEKRVERETSTFHEILSANEEQITEWVDAGAMTIGAETTAPTKGTTVLDSFRWRRVGDSMEVVLNYYQNAGGSVGSGDYLIDINATTGFNIDSTKLDGTGGANNTNAPTLGSAKIANTNAENATTGHIGVVTYGAGNNVKILAGTGTQANVIRYWGSDHIALSGIRFMSAKFTVPIEGWEIAPNYTVFEASPDSKVKIPTSELRMEGSSSRGSTNTAIIKFDNIAKIRGDAFTVDNSDGTSVTFKKAGLVNISCSLYRNGTNLNYSITKNQTNLTVFPAGGLESEKLATGSTSSTFYDSSSVSIFVDEGDIIRVSAQQNPTDTDGVNSLSITHQEQEIQVAISNVTPQYEDTDSLIRLSNAGSGTAGYGSTNTAIRRFTNQQVNIGSAISYVDSATLGASFTIVEDGYYDIHFTMAGDTDFAAGISLNSVNLSTNILTIPEAERLAHITQVAGSDGCASWSGPLSAGDIIRPHATTSESVTVRNSRSTFSIAKVGVPSIAEVDVTPFVDLQDQGWKVNSLKLEGTGGQAITQAVTDIPYNGGGKGWGSGIYTVQNDDAIFEISCAIQCVADSSRRVALYKDGVFYRYIGDQSPASVNYTVGDYTSSKGEFSSGDKLSIRSVSNGGTLLTGTEFNYLIINEWYRADQYERIYAVEDNENEFSAVLYDDGITASIISTSASFIKQVDRTGAGKVRIQWIDGFFTEVPSVVATSHAAANNDDRSAHVNLFETYDVNEVTIQNTANGSGSGAYFSINVSRQGADRKDLQRQLAVISDFPRVNNQLNQYLAFSALASTMTANGNSVNRYGPGVTSDGDSIVSYDDSTGYITALRDCHVNVSLSWRSVGVISSSINRVTPSSYSYSSSQNSGGQHDVVSASFKMRKGDQFETRSNGAYQSTELVRLNVVAQAQEIVVVGKAERSETEEKILTADISSTQDVSDLQFNDLVVGQSYIITGQPYILATSGNGGLKAYSGAGATGTYYGSIFRNGNSDTPTATHANGVSLIFTASSETLYIRYDTNNNEVLAGNSTKDETFLQLTNLTAQFMVEVPVPKVAILKDVKAQGTQGQSIPDDAWTTRDLNTAEGDTEILSFSANQFTLGRGKYTIEWSSPQRGGGNGITRLRNITDSSDSGRGDNTSGDNTSLDTVKSNGFAMLELSSSKTFEIQHYVNAGAVVGGSAINLSGYSEIYTQVKITKLD